ncbi:MAG: AAA family ATPase [Gammaproteobacteria bacterium]|jgi:aminoglycoside phosphotransferase family enzyme/predicted kinase
MSDLISSLIDYLRTRPDTASIDTIETHISWVVLTGTQVYKIKKPVNLGFVDFTTLEKRRHFCFEELRLNKRLAPELYIDVVTLTRTGNAVCVNGEGEIVDYAVRLHQFDTHHQLDHLISDHQLRFEHIDQLAAIVADFHRSVERAPLTSDFGKPEIIHGAVKENFHHCLQLAVNEKKRLQHLQDWSNKEFDRLYGYLIQRKNDGFVRECHGDLHLGNITLFHGRVTPFDCIEFNPDFRWIDVISEIAFLVMDLISRGRQDMAMRFLNDYLTHTGDYKGLTGLRYYLVYRAMVRAKVEIIRADQIQDEQQRNLALSHFQHYIELADRFRRKKCPTLFITHGMSGSGKTTVVRELLKEIPAIHLRSDVERKRLYHLKPTDKSASAIEQGIYTREASGMTYDTLGKLAASLLNNGWNTVVDATFLKQPQRAAFQQLAEQSQARFLILDFTADPESLRQRVISRSQQKDAISEATLEILENQLESYQPLTAAEQHHCIDIDTRWSVDIKPLASTILSRLE